jgi:hypothetical protein
MADTAKQFNAQVVQARTKLVTDLRADNRARRNRIKRHKANPLLLDEDPIYLGTVSDATYDDLAAVAKEKEESKGNYVSASRPLRTAGDTHIKFGDTEEVIRGQEKLYMRLVEIYAFRVGKPDNVAVIHITETAETHASGKTGLESRILKYYREVKEEITSRIHYAVLGVVDTHGGRKFWAEETTAEDRRGIFIHMMNEYPIAIFENLLGPCANSIDYHGIIWNEQPETSKWRTWMIERTVDMAELAFNLFVKEPFEKGSMVFNSRMSKLEARFDRGCPDLALKLGLGDIELVPCRPGGAKSKGPTPKNKN